MTHYPKPYGAPSLPRRWLLKACGAVSALGTIGWNIPFLNFGSANMLIGTTARVAGTSVGPKAHIAVIGAGAFGGWTALHLLRRGARVTLLDAWGPGNSRASSGGETRVIRGTYGPNQPYTKMTARALQLWKEHEKRWSRQFFQRAGVLWMAARGDDQFERQSLPMLREAGVPYEELSAADLRKRWPQVNFEDIHWAIYEPECGFLFARMACQAVLEGFIAEGGQYKQAAVLPRDLGQHKWDSLHLADGSKLNADHYVFACGP
ncbi:MAG TPA: FAD-dependent oxidoreductase, partial [Terriglobales bacterium]